jgi:hypothetical protein
MVRVVHPGSGSLFFTHPGFRSGSATLNERKTKKQRYCDRLRKKENDYYKVLLSVAHPWHLVGIRIRGSVSLTNGSGSSVTFKTSTPKKIFKVFLVFFLMIEGSGSVPLIKRSGPGRPKNLGSRSGLQYCREGNIEKALVPCHARTAMSATYKFSAFAHGKYCSPICRYRYLFISPDHG